MVGGDPYLLDVDRARRDFPSIKRRIVELAIQWNARNIIIEDKGLGTPLFQQLRNEHHGTPYPTAFLPRDDKITRLHAQSARIEAGPVSGGTTTSPCAANMTNFLWTVTADLRPNEAIISGT